MERASGIRKGLKVYTADGFRIGRTGEVREPLRAEDMPGGGPSRPVRNAGRVRGDVVDVDITGSLPPAAAEQPSQAERGVRLGDRPAVSTVIERAADEDVGTDYKEMGETADPRPPSELRDARAADGYVKVDTGLDSADLYVPLSAVDHVTRERAVLSLTREQLNGTGWGARPRGDFAPAPSGGLLGRLMPFRRSGGGAAGGGTTAHGEVAPGRAHAQEPLQPDGAERHVVPVSRYLLVFGALLALTFLTVLAANYDLGGVLNEAVALGIAALKASLVVLFFMHVRYSTPLLRLVVAVGFVWFGVMVLFTMSDFVSRGWRSAPPRQLTAPVEQAPPPVPGDRPVLRPQPTRAAPGTGEEMPAGE